MARTVAIGVQDFEEIISKDCFYIDKTKLIKEWWESMDEVTLITRPRRFGKTLNMNMLKRFFSVKFKGHGEVFANLAIWKEEKYRELQGTYPVISLSFANMKAKDFENTVYRICQTFQDIYIENYYLLKSDVLTDEEKYHFKKMAGEMSEKDVPMALNKLSNYLSRYYGKKVIIFLDEYDTPMQEAYVSGYWNEIVNLFRELFNSTFKTNTYLERAVMTGITRVSKESIFSDLNNLNVVTTTSNKYADSFGFTESEVFAAMDEMGFTDSDKGDVKRWYDGFTFGKCTDIYNPWSIINYLDKRELNLYWANTSSNSLVGNLLQQGNADIKMKFEELLEEKSIVCEIDEEVVYNQLEKKKNAIWSLLLASGYLKVIRAQTYKDIDSQRGKRPKYELALTNKEVRVMFECLIVDWFENGETNDYNDFVKAMLLGDVKAMNRYMNRVAMKTFSYFDTGKHPSESEPERFYHGFVLGLMIDLADRYILTSNRESGFGRYDVMLEPKNKDDDAFIIEFKVHDPDDEKDLGEAVKAALQQIEEKQYEQLLLDHGVGRECIRKYGFAFEGKKVLIGA